MIRKLFSRIPYLKLAIWTTGTILLITLTILSALPLLTDYQYNNVATQIDVVKDQMAQRPNVTICIPFRSGALRGLVKRLTRQEVNHTNDDVLCHCEGMKNHTWDVWTNTSHGPSNLTDENELATAILTKLIEDRDENFTAMTLDEVNLNWNEPIVEAVRKLFACITYQDITFITKAMDSSNVCENFYMSILESLSQRDIDKLFDLVIDTIDIYLSINTTFLGQASTLGKLRERRERVSIKGDYFCSPLLWNSTREVFVFSPFSDDKEPPWNRRESPDRRLKGKVQPRHGVFSLWPDMTVLYSFVEEYEAIYPTEAIPSHAEQANLDVVSLAYALETRVLETRPGKPCDPSTSPFQICLAERQVEKAIQLCSCIPFLHRHLVGHAPGLPYCTTVHYKSCQPKLEESFSDNYEQCRNKCEINFYKWQHFALSTKVEDRSMTFAINVTAVNIAFVEFRITVKNTPESFLSQIGGIVNLYLGFSGVTLCAILISCLNVIRQKIRNGGTENTAVRLESYSGRDQSFERAQKNKNDQREIVSNFVTKQELQRIVEGLKTEFRMGRGRFISK